jgi:glycerol-3-phosphate dehydrogenase
MSIAVIGGGINGIFSAWSLASHGYKVDLFEADKLLGKTSSASSKLLHGGIRYLEQGHLGLVRESLLDRAWWLENAPHATRPIEICMPVYRNSSRGLLKLFAGAKIYRLLAGKFSLGPSRLLKYNQLMKSYSELEHKNLIGAVTFYDGQMDEEKLGFWVRDRAIEAGVNIYEGEKVVSFSASGDLSTKSNEPKRYRLIINAAGPWAAKLNEQNNIDSRFSLDLVRGSHLLIDYKIEGSYLFQDPASKRVIYALDYFGNALVGTTEVMQENPNRAVCSNEERDFMIKIFNDHFNHNIGYKNIIREYSGLRPILSRKEKLCKHNFSRASREAEIEVVGKVLTIFGGKWTSSPSLSRKVLKKVNQMGV